MFGGTTVDEATTDGTTAGRATVGEATTDGTTSGW